MKKKAVNGLNTKVGNIRQPYDPRQGWAEAAEQMNAAEDDKLLMGDFSNQFDQEEWTW